MNKKTIVLLITVFMLILAPVFAYAAEDIMATVEPTLEAAGSLEDSAFANTFLGKIIITILVAMVPVIELRGAIPIGVGMGLEYYVAVLFSLIGNILPVPFIVLFFRRFFEWLAKKVKIFDKVWTALKNRTIRKSDVVEKYGFWGLCILVAIPLPGTGAWTGAMVACILEIPMKKSMPAIILGVVIAAVIVTAVTYLGFDVIF